MTPDELSMLEEQRAFLQRSLDDLDREHGAGDLADDDLTVLRADYHRRLVAVDEQIGGGAADLSAPAPMPRRRRALATAAVVLLVAVGAGVAVSQAAGTRRPGESLSGSVRSGTSAKLAEAARLARLEPVEGLRLYDEVLAEEPDNVEALAERGFLLVTLGFDVERPTLVTQGRVSLDRALRLDPDNPRTLFYLGLALRLDGQAEASDQLFDRALASDPPPALRTQIEAFRRSTADG